MTDDEIVAAVAPNLQRYIDGDLARRSTRTGEAWQRRCAT